MQLPLKRTSTRAASGKNYLHVTAIKMKARAGIAQFTYIGHELEMAALVSWQRTILLLSVVI